MGDTLVSISPRDCRAWAQVDALLEREGIRRDANLDYTCGIVDGDGRLIATGSTFGSTLRCCAVDSSHRGEGLLSRIITHLLEHQAERGRHHLFVCTKCQSAGFFQDMGFHEIARVEGTLSFLENRRSGFASYCAELAQSRREGSSAVIVMNANPFTLGHRHLVERAAAENDWVHLFVLSGDAELIPFDVRWKLVREGVSDLKNVLCHPGGPYIISAATFPSYFLRDEEAVIRGHARLDLALFPPIAGALGASARYAGEEPRSLVTGIYNQIMARELPAAGIRCEIIPRLARNGAAISAGTVRQWIHDGRLADIRELVPAATWNYFNSPEAAPVIGAIRESESVIHY